MNSQYERALEYIGNSGGFPSVKQFLEDYEPVGTELIADLITRGLVRLSSNEDGDRFIYETGKSVLHYLSMPKRMAPR